MASISDQTILRWIAVAGELPEARNFGPAVINIKAHTESGLQSWCFDVGTKPRLLNASVSPQATVELTPGADLYKTSPQVLAANGELECEGEPEVILLWSRILRKALTITRPQGI